MVEELQKERFIDLSNCCCEIFVTMMTKNTSDTIAENERIESNKETQNKKKKKHKKKKMHI